ncbi:MAG: hypothetical protein HY698_19625 [Deltaproteobacteria bacterium]|nr:hypothetical protein [Deltaproteobacteria bacterium]
MPDSSPLDASTLDSGGMDAGWSNAAWAAISAGRTHSCGIDVDGRLFCWGNGRNGKLGNRDTRTHSTPQFVLGPSGATWESVSAGGEHACAIRKDDGSLWCWGAGDDGRLGTPQSSEASEPRQVEPGSTGWTSVSAGGAHTCAIRDGSLFCWGINIVGQVGHGSSDSAAYTPKQVGLAPGWTSVSAGEFHSCGVRDEKLYCWGANSFGQLGVDSGNAPLRAPPGTAVGGNASWVAVAAGGSHTCAIQKDPRTLWCFGRNDLRQLGCEGEACSGPTPVQVGMLADWDEVTTGSSHSCARRGSHVECWGHNEFGQVGLGSFRPAAALPSRVQGPPVKWVQVAAGSEHTCGVDQDGGGFCWGNASRGQRGDGEESDRQAPSRIAGEVGEWKSVAAGWSRHACGIAQDGALLCWGANDAGQLGNGSMSDIDSDSPGKIASSSTFSAVGAGENFACGLDQTKRLTCWGTNFEGELGFAGDSTGAPTPWPDVTDWESVSIRSSRGCGIRGAERTAWCWGRSFGALARVGSETGWALVSAGIQSSCGIRDRQLYCWGAGGSSPTRVGTESDWEWVSTGYELTCGIRVAGASRTLWCGPSQSSAPFVGSLSQVTTSTDWVKVECGFDNACALTTLGDLFCWGRNDRGEVGIGSVYADKPTLVQSSGPWADMSLGETTTCARAKNDNGLWCWGQGHRGQLGTGHAARPMPRPLRR